MNRGVLAANRAALFVVGAVLVCAGVAMAGWWLAVDRDLRLGGWTWGSELSLDPPLQRTQTPWWPWATGAAGVLLLLLGIRWLARHLVSARVRDIRLPGSGSAGTLEAAVSPVFAAAAAALATTPGVRSATGRIQDRRRQITARIDATIEPRSDLRVVGSACERVAADLRTVLGRDDVTSCIVLSVPRRGRGVPRVR